MAHPNVDFTMQAVEDMICLAEAITIQKAMAGEDRTNWLDAIEVERSALMKHDFAIPLSKEDERQVPESKVIPLRLVLTRKEDGRFKCRCVALGNRMVDDHSAYSPVGKNSTLKILLSIAARKRLTLEQIDISNAYVQAPCSRDLFVKLPPQWRDPSRPETERTWKLKRNLYGMKDAGLAWYEFFRKFLLDKGWKEWQPTLACS